MGRRAEQKKRREVKNDQAKVVNPVEPLFQPLICTIECEITNPNGRVETKRPTLFGDNDELRTEAFDIIRRVLVRAYGH